MELYENGNVRESTEATARRASRSYNQDIPHLSVITSIKSAINLNSSKETQGSISRWQAEEGHAPLSLRKSSWIDHCTACLYPQFPEDRLGDVGHAMRR